MARRKKDSILDDIASMPWPFGLVLGIIAFLFVRNFGGQMFAPLAWLFLAACWIAAGSSFFSRRRRQQLFDTQTGLDSLSRMNWREFEMLVGEAFRRRGWDVEETGLGGKDGGIDLILRKQDRFELVQCKQWRSRQVGAAKVREMWGLVDHHDADGVHIVCIGAFTPDATKFAEGKAIELINGQRLLELILPGPPPSTSVSKLPTANVGVDVTSSAPACPDCGSAMLLRKNKRNSESFWGCSVFPACRGTRRVRSQAR